MLSTQYPVVKPLQRVLSWCLVLNQVDAHAYVNWWLEGKHDCDYKEVIDMCVSGDFRLETEKPLDRRSAAHH